MRTINLLICILPLFVIHIQAQKKENTKDNIITPAKLKDTLKRNVIETDTVTKNKFVTDRAFNLFLQKKTSIYLTGASEVSLSKLFATYNTDNDKFNFGVNFKIKTDNEQLKYLITPMLETNIKNNFSTLYKKGKWQADIRLGAKFSCFLGGTINYNGNQKIDMLKTRNSELDKILTKIDGDEKNETTQRIKEKELLSDFKNNLVREIKKNVNNTEEVKKKQEIVAAIDNQIKNIDDKKTYDEEYDNYKTQIANKEVEALYKKKAYIWFHTFWLSGWGFIPITEKKTFIASDNTQNFKEQKLKLWEGNLQFNWIIENNEIGSVYVSSGWKVFQNNSAIADLMTSVDYYQYSQFPPTNVTTNNLALLENNKAFIGDFKEFVSNNLYVQVVLTLSDTNSKNKEKFCTPGVSFRIEKNVGEYSATNLRFGLPLRFRGKTNSVNIEPQIRLNNINNYSNKVDYKIEPIIGINVGLPIAALFKY